MPPSANATTLARASSTTVSATTLLGIAGGNLPEARWRLGFTLKRCGRATKCWFTPGPRHQRPVPPLPPITQPQIRGVPSLMLHLLLDAMPRQVGQGQYFVLWGGSTLGDEVEFGNGAAYHPETGQWFALPPAPEGAERDRHAMVWIHGQLYISGGFQTTGPLVFKPELTG